MSIEVRADSRLSSSSAEAELSVELNSCLKLLEIRLAILSEPVTLSTTGDGDVFCYQKIDALQTISYGWGFGAMPQPTLHS